MRDLGLSLLVLSLIAMIVVEPRVSDVPAERATSDDESEEEEEEEKEEKKNVCTVVAEIPPYRPRPSHEGSSLLAASGSY